MRVLVLYLLYVYSLGLAGASHDSRQTQNGGVPQFVECSASDNGERIGESNTAVGGAGNCLGECPCNSHPNVRCLDPGATLDPSGNNEHVGERQGSAKKYCYCCSNAEDENDQGRFFNYECAAAAEDTVHFPMYTKQDPGSKEFFEFVSYGESTTRFYYDEVEACTYSEDPAPPSAPPSSPAPPATPPMPPSTPPPSLPPSIPPTSYVDAGGVFADEGDAASSGDASGTTLNGCKALCDTAPLGDCVSFSYNDATNDCQTKTKCGSPTCPLNYAQPRDWNTYYRDDTGCTSLCGGKPTCDSTMQVRMFTTETGLCVDGSSGGWVQYTARPCASNTTNAIEYTTAKTHPPDIRTDKSESECEGWDFANDAFYAGSCGVPPTVVGGDSLPTECVSSAPQSSVTGDPFTEDPKGRRVRFFLRVDSLTSLIKQPPGVEVLALGGPDVGKGDMRRGDWVKAFRLLVGGQLILEATVRSIVELLPAGLVGPYTHGRHLKEERDEERNNAVEMEKAAQEADDNAPPAAADDISASTARLTSLNLTLPDGKTIREAGSFDLHVKNMPTLPVHVTVSQVADKRIGTGHVETATIKVGESFELVLWTAKAHKFREELDQIAFAHLDFKMLKYDIKTVTGALPEMWGLRPLSQVTAAMLGAHAVA